MRKVFVLFALISSAALFAATAPSSSAAVTSHSATAMVAKKKNKSNCTLGYSPCLPKGPSDYDCYGGGGNGPAYTKPGVVYKVTGSDPYRLDSNNNGLGCE